MERLRKRLYSHDQPDAEYNESDLSAPDRPDTPDNWQHHDNGPTNSHGWLNKFLVFAGIFCVLAAGFAISTVWMGSSGVSPNQVDISVSGPSTISAGETVDMTVGVSNNNQVPLENVSLTAVFPPGTRQPDTSGNELRRIRRELDTISPNETRNVNLAASLFGQQDQTQEVDIRLEYQVPESNAIFSANRPYSVNIGELPVAVTVNSPDQTAPGQPVNFQVNIQSNSAKPLKDIILRANYPFGFSTTQVSPQPQYRDYVWSLGNLEPGGSRSIEIDGRFADSVSAGQRTFTFSSGIASEQSSTTIGTLFADREAVLSLREPYIDLALNLQRDSNNRPLVLSPGESISGNVAYSSNLDNPVRGADIDLEFIGNAIDLDSVTSEAGLYRQPEKTIRWNTQTNDQLQIIQAGESESFSFSFTNKTDETLIGTNNPTAEMRAQLSADTPEGSDLPRTVSVETVRSPRLHSGVAVEVASLHDNGPFATSGPLPPAVGELTEYTAHIVVRNTTNELSDLNLQAAVPAFVSIAGEPQASVGSFTYNDVTGRLRWDVSELNAGAGYDQPPAEIFIPLEITPTSGESEEEPKLLTDIVLTAQDEFAGQTIELTDITEPSTIPASTGDDGDDAGTVQPRDE
jgi:uncharacterized repeat protein (TIGR01451 family)